MGFPHCDKICFSQTSRIRRHALSTSKRTCGIQNGSTKYFCGVFSTSKCSHTNFVWKVRIRNFLLVKKSGVFWSLHNTFCPLVHFSHFRYIFRPVSPQTPFLAPFGKKYIGVIFTEAWKRMGGYPLSRNSFLCENLMHKGRGWRLGHS